MKRMPLVVYGATYVFTCFIGAVCLMTSPSVVALQQVLAGAQPFWLSSEQVFSNLLLLLASPLLVIVGYEVGLRHLPAWTNGGEDGARGGRLDLPLAFGLWAAACAGGLVSLWRAGAFELITSWANYRAWVFARWQLFDTLSMWEFVNIYILVPVATSLLVMQWLRARGTTPARVLGGLAIVAPMFVIDILVYQKKTIIVSAVIVGLATAIRLGVLDRSTSRRLWLSLAGVALLGWLLYVFTILRPTVGKRAQAMTDPVAQAPPLLAPAPEPRQAGERPSPVKAASTAEPPAVTGAAPAPPAASPAEKVRAAGVGPTGKPFPEPRRSRILRSVIQRLFPGRWIGLPPGSSASVRTLSRGPFLTFYVLLGPMLRTPLPALMYPAVYPGLIPFFGADVGLDVLGIGRMPYDNIQVHRLLWPAIDGGTVMVPFQFASYSQAGLGGALGTSLAAGFCLAGIWIRVRSLRSRDAGAAASALVLILAVYLAGDSIRNSLIASYGVFWGLIALLLWTRLLRFGGPIHAESGRAH